MRIESDTKDFGVFGQGDEGAIVLDLRVMMMLVRISRKKGHARLFRRDGEKLSLGPFRDPAVDDVRVDIRSKD